MIFSLPPALAYLGCALLFHSRPARSGFTALAQSPAALRWLRVLAWLLLLLSLLTQVWLQGAERGIATWLATLCIAGLASLFVAIFANRWHRLSIGLTTLCTIVAAVAASTSV